MAATRTAAAPTAPGTPPPLRPIGIGPCYGINMGSGWGKLLAVFEPDEEAARVAAETAKATRDTAPDGIAGPAENELEVVFPAMIGEAGDAEGSIARVDTVQWDKLYVVGEDALARNPRTMPAQARLQDDDFLPIMTRGAFAKLMKLALARIEVLITQEMFRLRGESVPPYSRLLADELERLRGVRFDPVKGEVGPISAAIAESRPRPSKEPHPGANAVLENQVRAKFVEREGRRSALPEQIRSGPAVTGLPASWIDIPGHQSLLGKRLRAGAPGITRMRSIAEPLAILYSLALNGNGEEINPTLMTGRYGFADMGFLTVDVDEVFNMRPQEDGRDTWDLGAVGPVGQIRRMLSAHFDTPFEPFEVELAIRTGKIKVGGKLRDLPNHWDEPLNRQGRTIRDRLVHKWRSGNQFDAIFLGGGWASEERIVAPILTTFGNAQCVARSQISIARGYAYLARRQAAEEAAKQAHKTSRADAPVLAAETAGA